MVVDWKIITFYLGEKDFKYKYPSHMDDSVIDKTFREYFNISNDSEYHLLDMQDHTFINVSSLKYLNNESKVLIQLKKNVPASSTNKDSSTTHSSPDPEPIRLANNPETLSFSDNNDKILVDLSSPGSTSTSESGGEKRNIHYVSKTNPTGVNKIKHAQQRKKDQELRILCNKKIYYFLEKHAKTSSVATVSIAKELKDKLHINSNQLYDFLKFVRHKTDCLSLNLNGENVVNILSNVYQTDYPNHS